MKDEGLRVKDEEWRMKNEGWRIKDEEWRMKNEGWKMKDEEWRMNDEGYIHCIRTNQEDWIIVFVWISCWANKPLDHWLYRLSLSDN